MWAYHVASEEMIGSTWDAALRLLLAADRRFLSHEEQSCEGCELSSHQRILRGPPEGGLLTNLRSDDS